MLAHDALWLLMAGQFNARFRPGKLSTAIYINHWISKAVAALYFSESVTPHSPTGQGSSPGKQDDDLAPSSFFPSSEKFCNSLGKAAFLSAILQHVLQALLRVGEFSGFPVSNMEITVARGDGAVTGSLMRWRVIIVCADLHKRQVIEVAVRGWTEDVVYCALLREAQEKLGHSNTPTIVFCEQHLSDGSYGDLLVSLRRGPRKTRVVVMMPGTNPEAEYQEAMQQGAFQVMMSPYRHDDARWMVIQAVQEEARRNY
jgi:CheY-like chemotaxis protein